MTDEQYKELALTLANTSTNVYTLAKQRFGVDWSDANFDKLELVAGLFKCEECGVWLDKAEKDLDVAGFCTTCIDEMDD